MPTNYLNWNYQVFPAHELRHIATGTLNTTSWVHVISEGAKTAEEAEQALRERIEEFWHKWEPEVMLDGIPYWLGACWGIYRLETDTFSLGNCFVRRYDTRFADYPVGENTLEVLE